MIILQTIAKLIYNSISPNNLIFTFLIFRSYSYILEFESLTLQIT